MEPGPASRLTARKRRAVALIAISVFALAVAGLTWIGPTLHPGEAAKLKTITADPVSTTPSPQALLPTMYDFANMSAGWAVIARPTGTTVFKTVDGGKRWIVASRLAGSVDATIQFVDTTHGFVVTANPNRLYRTTDGGAHWTLAVMPGETLSRITFTDARYGSAWVPPVFPNYWGLYTTEDGGDTWHQLRDVPQDSFDPVFRGPEAWLSAHASPPGRLHVYTSVDRGLGWSIVDVPRPPAFQPVSAGPQFFTAQVNLLPGGGVAVLLSVGTECQKSTPCVRPDEILFSSFDRGGSWTGVPPPPSAFTFRDIAYQDSVHWWALGQGSLFKSSDAGHTWQLVSSTAPPGRPVLHVVDSQHAWAQLPTVTQTKDGAFAVSAVVATGDGGLSWTRVQPPKIS
jgi:photosystem II stability/assembly factor-like uncharacterized protein